MKKYSDMSYYEKITMIENAQEVLKAYDMNDMSGAASLLGVHFGIEISEIEISEMTKQDVLNIQLNRAK